MTDYMADNKEPPTTLEERLTFMEKAQRLVIPYHNIRGEMRVVHMGRAIIILVSPTLDRPDAHKELIRDFLHVDIDDLADSHETVVRDNHTFGGYGVSTENCYEGFSVLNNLYTVQDMLIDPQKPIKARPGAEWLGVQQAAVAHAIRLCVDFTKETAIMCGGKIRYD